MTKIKICGTRRMEDIAVYNRLGIDYAGFIFAESPRKVKICEAAAMRAELCSARAAGVFVNADEAEICAAAEKCRLDIIQLHGTENAEFALNIKKKTGCEIWRALRVKEEIPPGLENYPADRFLLDTWCKSYGGSGKSFDWRLLDGIDMAKIILAGGISPKNAADACRTGAYALDLNSGVETDGFKDEKKICAAVSEIRAVI